MAKSLYRGMPVTLVASGARTSSSNSGNLKDTVNALPVGDAVSLILNVTAHTADASPNFDCYFDISPDGGTTWIATEKFASVTGSTGTQVIQFRQSGIGAVEAASQAWTMTTTGSIAVATNTVVPPDHRVRWVIAGTGTTTATFAVYAVVQPSGSARG
jgi:hypothetical protein